VTRPTKQLPAAAPADHLAKQATATLAKLQPGEVRERLGLDEEELAVLSAIARGQPVRNASLALRAIEVKLKATLSPPPQAIDLRHIVLPLRNPFAAPTNDEPRIIEMVVGPPDAGKKK
jgi:hypothetical protein